MEDPFLVLPMHDRTEGIVDLIRRCATAGFCGGGGAAPAGAETHSTVCRRCENLCGAKNDPFTPLVCSFLSFPPPHFPPPPNAQHL